MSQPERRLTKPDRVDPDSLAAPDVAPRTPPPWVDAGSAPPGNLASYLELPFVHKWLILVCTLLGAMSGWLVIALWPRSYGSEARLQIRIGRESVSLDPTATTSETLLFQKTQEEEIISALEVLNSRQIAATVVEHLGTDLLLDDSPPVGAGGPGARSSRATTVSGVARICQQSLSTWLDAALLGAGLRDRLSDREVAVRQLQSSLSIYSPRKSNVIVIEARAASPPAAQVIASQVTESFLVAHQQGAVIDGSYPFFEQQSAAAESELNQLVQQRTDFLRAHQIVSIDANRQLLQEQLSGVDRDIAVAAGEIQQTAAEVAQLRSDAAATEDQVVAAKLDAADGTWSGMRQRVYELELNEQKYQSMYTDQHIKLKQVQRQLAGAREILAQLESERTDKTTTPNPVKTRLEEELKRHQTRLTGLQSLIEEKQQQRRELEVQVEQLLEHEHQLMQLDRDIQIADRRLQLLREKQEEARVIDELTSERISNVRVFQPATLVGRPVSPQKKPLAAGFVFLGLVTGLGLSWMRQASSPTLRTVEDVQSRLGVPVVSTIPRLSRMASPQFQEQKQLRGRYQSLIAEVLLCRDTRRRLRGYSLGVIGVESGAGASTLAANLAIASSIDRGIQTVLVDADTRQRSVSQMFGLNGSPGLVELLSGSASHAECLQKPQDGPIELVASAAEGSHHALTHSTAEIAQAIESYLQNCDLLIVDLPAANQADPAVGLAQHLDSVLLVVESEKTLSADAERLLRRLQTNGAGVLGVVLNKSRNYLPKALRGYLHRPA